MEKAFASAKNIEVYLGSLMAHASIEGKIHIHIFLQPIRQWIYDDNRGKLCSVFVLVSIVVFTQDLSLSITDQSNPSVGVQYEVIIWF